MHVKIADLKNNLSRYLAKLRETGETIIICDRDKPIATLTPLVRDDDAEWQRERGECLARAKKIGLKIDIPLHRPDTNCMPDVTPRVAPDGRTDIHTIDLVRKGRNY